VDPTDEDVKFFALLELHRLQDLVSMWQLHTSGLPMSDEQDDWGIIPDRPPPLKWAWVCRRGREEVGEVRSPPEEEEVVSSDDDDDGELEEAPEAEDLAFLTALDHVIDDEE
jgi:hypothetical protein